VPCFRFFPDIVQRLVDDAAVQAFLDGRLQRPELGVLLLITSYQVADIFAVICVLTSGNTGLNPLVLLVRQGDRFSCGPHIDF
jgi:hypothetical protein